MTVPLRQPLVHELEVELSVTRPLLERLPGDRLEFRPHEKSMSLGRLATHIGECARYGWQVLATESIDSASPATPRPTLDSVGDIVTAFDREGAAFVAALESASDELLLGSWSYRKGERTIFEVRRVGALRRFVLNHLVHHRGQLTVYLRLLGVELPQVYGPSADDREGYA